MTYTAEEVRAHAQILIDWRDRSDSGVGNDDAADMLTAYADLLDRRAEGVTDAQVEAIIDHVGRVNSIDGMDGDSWDRLLVRAALESAVWPAAAEPAQPITLSEFVHMPADDRKVIGQAVAERVDQMQAEPAQPADSGRVTKEIVRTALNLCPTELSSPERWSWIATHLNVALAAQGRGEQPALWIEFTEDGHNIRLWTRHEQQATEEAREGRKLQAFYTHPAAPASPAHSDDVAVDAFAAAMKEKLAAARAKGRGGWQDKDDCPQQRLSDMLRAHVDKGDPSDVANFCMFLHQRGEGILPASPAGVPEGWTVSKSQMYDGYCVDGKNTSTLVTASNNLYYFFKALTAAQESQPNG